MLGAVSVGKTSLVRQYVDSLFSDRYHSTVGVRVDKKSVVVEGTEVVLMLWDLHGEAEHRPVADAYLRGMDACLLVVDADRPETVAAAASLAERVVAGHGPMPVALALNKADLVDDWSEAESACAALDVDASLRFRTSARTGEGVEDCFAAIAEALLPGSG